MKPLATHWGSVLLSFGPDKKWARYGRQEGLRCCLRLRVRICVRHEVIELLGTCRDALPLRTEVFVLYMRLSG